MAFSLRLLSNRGMAGTVKRGENSFPAEGSRLNGTRIRVEKVKAKLNPGFRGLYTEYI